MTTGKTEGPDRCEPSVWRDGLLVAAAGAIAIVCLLVGRAETALLPGEYDFRLFAYVGDLWTRGLIPYKDVWDNKPPGIFALMATLARFSPGPLVGTALAEALFLLAAAPAAFNIIRLATASVPAAFIGACLFVCCTSLPGLADGGGHTELFAAAVATWAAWFLARSLAANTWRTALAGGLMTGVATWFKLPGLAPWLAFVCLAVVLATLGRRTRRQVTALVLASVAGFAVAWMPWTLYFAGQGVVGEMLHVSLVYPFGYGPKHPQPWFNRLVVPAVHLRAVGHLLPLVLYVLGWVLQRAVRVWTREAPAGGCAGSQAATGAVGYLGGFAILWVAIDFAGGAFSGRNYAHYFLPLAGSMAVCAVIGAWAIIERAQPRVSRRAVARGLAALFLLPMLLWCVADAVDLARRLQYQRESAGAAAAAAILRRSSPSDRLFVWPYAPVIYQATGLLPATPYLTSVNLFDSPQSFRRIAPVIEDAIASGRARFVVMDVTSSAPPSTLGFRRRVIADLQERYTLVHAGEQLQVWVFGREP